MSATARSKREAEAVLNRLLAEVGAGRHSGPDVTMAELLEQWFAVASPDWSPKTVVETRRFIDNYVVPHLGRVKVRKLTTAQLDGFYGMLKKRGGREGRPLSVASVRRVHVVVRRALSQAKRWGWVSEDVAADASPGRLARREIAPFRRLVVTSHLTPAPDQADVRSGAAHPPGIAPGAGSTDRSSISAG